ncbi:CHAD domain-containing protein [bacterium]|nr:CHAD domain-containing protein [bacterium]MBU1884907.1 CHAD domain-containing protein [bacterium]
MRFEKSLKIKITLVEKLYKDLHENDDIEVLHKYRVTLRKMLAYSSVYGEKIDAKSSAKFSKILKKLLKPTSLLRDLDLLLIEIDLMDCPIQTKEKLRKIFTSKRDKKFQALLDDDRYKKNLKHLKSMSKKGRMFFYNIDKVDKYAIIQKVAKKLYDRFYKIDNNTSLGELHKLRIEFKKFRYALEAYEEFFNEEHKQFEKMYDLKELQDLFGIIQDNNIRLQFVDKIEDKLTTKELLGVRTYFDKRIQSAKKELFALIGK